MFRLASSLRVVKRGALVAAVGCTASFAHASSSPAPAPAAAAAPAAAPSRKPRFKLSYFNGRALGEMSRLILAATGTPFDEERYSLTLVPGAPRPLFGAEFVALQASGTLPYGQVPTLEVDGAAPIAQSKAIERFLARELGIAGATALQAARLDSVCEEVADVKAKYNAAKGDAEKKAAFLKAELPKMLGYVEKQLAAAGASSLTVADVYLYHLLTHFVAPDDKAAFEGAAPAGVKAAVAKVASNAGIAAWEAGRPGRKEIF